MCRRVAAAILITSISTSCGSQATPGSISPAGAGSSSATTSARKTQPKTLLVRRRRARKRGPLLVRRVGGSGCSTAPPAECD